MDASVLVHFTNRHRGVSEAPYWSNNLAYHVGDKPLHVNQNRCLTCKELDIDLSALVGMNQVHGNSVIRVDKGVKSQVLECDGLITNEPQLALMVQTADCTPVLMYAPDVGAIGALHVGRAGAFKGMIPKAIEKLKSDFGAKEDALHVWIGAAIGVCCYEINGEILDFAKQNYNHHVHGRYLDIGGIILNQLHQKNIQNIHHDKTCTSCNKDYFSYRRDGKTGRQAGIIMLRPNRG